MPTLADLFSFQQECVDKLVDERDSIIADDMGLGKTVEAIALDKVRRERQLKRNPKTPPMKTLVLCPLSVIDSWVEHFKEWQPELSVCTIDNKSRLPFEKAVRDKTHDVYIMHWDVLRLMPVLQTSFWFHIIADEAHRVSNRGAQVTIAAKKLKRHFLTQLTGTPSTTRPEQFWSLLNWAKPNRFTSFHRFYNHHVIYQKHNAGGDCLAILGPVRCGKFHQTSFNVIIGVAHEDELHAEIKAYYIRRLKEEVLKDLPEKYYTKIKVDLHPKQRKAYNDMRDDMLAWIGEHEGEPLAASQAVVKLIRLQQLACAYADFFDVIVKKKHEHNERCSPATSVEWDNDATQMIDKIEITCQIRYDEVEQRKVRLIDPSTKIDAVIEILEANPDKQFVVFSQSKQVINLFAKRLLSKKITHGVLTGDTAQVDRGFIVKAFQAGDLRVFTGTIAAGGVGITLTASSTIIFLDRSWSPAINRQAEDRLHRIGQKQAVQVIDIIAKDTIDLGRLQRLENSWQWIKQLLGDKDAKTKPDGAYI